MSQRIDTPVKRVGSDRRGVSDVLAFVLVFGIVISSVVLLSMVGFGAMESYQEGEQLRNAERAMAAFGDTANDVARYDGIESRSGEIAVRAGTLETGGENTTVGISDGADLDETIPLGSFVYESGSDTDRVVYEGGAVFRADDGGSALIGEPMIACGDAVAVVTLVQIDAADRSLLASDTKAVAVEKRAVERWTSDEGALTISIEGDSPTADGWRAAFGDDEWDCPADQAVVTVVTVDVRF